MENFISANKRLSMQRMKAVLRKGKRFYVVRKGMGHLYTQIVATPTRQARHLHARRRWSRYHLHRTGLGSIQAGSGCVWVMVIADEGVSLSTTCGLRSIEEGVTLS